MLLAAVTADRNVMVFDDILECHHTASGMRPWRRLRGPHGYGARATTPIDVPAEQWITSERLLIKPLLPTETVRSSKVTHSNRRFGADSEYFLRLIAGGLRLRYLPFPGYYYRVTPGSMTAIRSRYERLAEMLQDLSPLFAGSANITAALDAKVSSLKRLVNYQRFVMHLKAGDLKSAATLTAHNPRILLELVRRLVSDVGYRVHLRYHGGTGRG